MAAAENSGHGGWMRERMAKRQKAEDIEQQAADRIAGLDTDGDDRISEAEFVAGKNLLTVRLDRNGDGRITRGEIDESRAELRKEYRRRRDEGQTPL